MRVRLLSRASQLARLQAALVGRALVAADPRVKIAGMTRASTGDRDLASPLWQMGDKGAFTADLSGAIVNGEADLVVHSWKDLPIEQTSGTHIAGTLERADPRDVLIVRRAAVVERPERVAVLSSSPRRAWLLPKVLPGLLPWRVDDVTCEPVRGNIETRLRKLVEGGTHALVMAKAALDRLLSGDEPFQDTADVLRGYLARCHWMVLPMKEFPWAAAQGALAIEVSDRRPELSQLVAAISHSLTWDAVNRERWILADHGGGCHQALGAAIVQRDFGRVTSVRARGTDGADESCWTLDAGSSPAMPRATPSSIWPRAGEVVPTVRRRLEVERPDAASGLWVARAEALPPAWAVTPETLVWAAGSVTWRKLAAAGVWVHGSADGLGEDEPPSVDALAGRDVSWIRLTHRTAARPGELGTYEAEAQLPDDVSDRTHFYWTSGQLFLRAIERWPAIRAGWHASGPGRTRQIIAEIIGAGRAGVWLDRESWERDVCQ